MEIDTVVHVYEPLIPGVSKEEAKSSDDVVLAKGCWADFQSDQLAKSCAGYCIPYIAMVLTAVLCGYYFWR